MTELVGVGVSPGVAVGHALVIEREAVPVFRLIVPPEAVEPEIERLRQAVALSRKQLLAIKERLSRERGVPHAYIFDAHLLMLEDPLLIDEAESFIRQEGVNAEWALRTVSERLHEVFESVTDDYLRERTIDLEDVLGRIQINLGGGRDAPSLSRLPGSFVLVAEDLAPSEAAELDWDRVLAVAIDAGSPTYHTAILARSFGVPAVVGLREATRVVPPGSLLVVDGTRGRVVIEPSAPAVAGARAEQERDRAEERRRVHETRTLPAVTLDGASIRLLANAEFPEEAASGVEYGAEGIGLFRSEYLLGRGRPWPTEERQVEAYKRLLDAVAPHPVTVRTWDLGVEDLAPGGPSSPNPALGQRALRLIARNPEPFHTQMRALLRASAHGPLRIMLPFVGGPGDLRAALDLLDAARADLTRAGIPFAPVVPIGVTIEVPSAALTLDLIAPHVDFVSIGTNDLIQYVLAVDRADPRVAALYQPLHPAVLRIVHRIVEAAAASGRPVSVCGEMAAEPLHCLALVGLGIHEFSLAPVAIPRIKEMLRASRADLARAAARACLDLPTAGEVEALLRRQLPATVAAVRGEPS